MAGKSALPLLLLGGAAVIAMSGKKKKRPPPDVPDVVPPLDDFPLPPPAKRGAPIPYWKKAGAPPRGDKYDGPYWNPSPGAPRLISIRQHFADAGYPVEVGPWPMNELGPAGGLELENKSGSMGKLGGNDDEPSETVRTFQKEYNAVSESKVFGTSMGGLAPDGLVGPYTLNALRYITETLGGKRWRDDVVKQAGIKGYSIA